MQETVNKSAQASGYDATDRDLEQINAYAIRPLDLESVFTFKVTMCDNEVDRDHERFPLETLRTLAELFRGKTVIADHEHRAGNQIARIYDTAVEAGDGITMGGEPYHRLVAKCYMLRSEGNRELIADIEAGIRKEVSVGCSIRSAVCSVCGVDAHSGYCKHRPGQRYEGNICFRSLMDAQDAYELSFVAVPAQPRAGVTKGRMGASQAEDRLRLEIDRVDRFLFVQKEKMMEVQT